MQDAPFLIRIPAFFALITATLKKIGIADFVHSTRWMFAHWSCFLFDENLGKKSTDTIQ